MKRICLIFLLMNSANFLWGQDSIAAAKAFTYRGYVKNLESLNFNKDFSQLHSNNLIHNRINFKWELSPHIQVVSEFRNRIIWGEQVNKIFHFIAPNNYWGLQKTWIDRENLWAHTNTERLYANFNKNKWNIRLGRQRINWGISTTWNPNDIYNTFNFLDIDYEERPGADALHAVYVISDFSNLSMVHSKSQHKGSITALRYFFNKYQYDLQVIGGRYHEQGTIGFGWAGNIKDAGFKGEFQYYFSNALRKSMLNSSVEIDQTFKNGWYVKGGVLYNHRGISKSIRTFADLDLSITPENLMPARWNFTGACQKEIDPLSSLSVQLIYAPGMRLFIMMPSYQYNIATNWDLDCMAQSFFLSINHSFQAVQHNSMFRIRWSF